MNVSAGERAKVVLAWLRGYDRSALAPDLLAGLTTAAVALPKAMAYATVAGLPVQNGLSTPPSRRPSSTPWSDVRPS